MIGQKARSSGCDWFIQLSDNRCPITAFCSDIDIRLRKNRVLNEPIRFEEIVIFIMSIIIIVIVIIVVAIVIVIIIVSMNIDIKFSINKISLNITHQTVIYNR